MNLKNMKIKTKLIAGFGLVIVLSVILSVFAVIALKNTTGEYDGLMKYSQQRLKYILDIKYDVMDIRRITTAINAYCGDKSRQEGYKTESDKVCDTVYSEADAFIDLVKNDKTLKEEDKTSLLEKSNSLKTILAQYKKDLIDVNIAHAINNDKNAVVANASAQGNLISDLQGIITELSDFEKDLSEKGLAKVESHADFYRILFIGIVALIVVISLGLAFVISGGISKNLADIIDKLLNISNTVKNSASLISEGSDSLAEGATKQAAAIEETSATMNESASMISQTAESTKAAVKISDEAAKVAKDAGEYMTELMEAMNELIDSSDKIGKIVKTIDDIALQTNLLAINATVEAARAGGDAGRSFSVVAEEVRNLAKKSGTSALSTTEIIDRNITLTNSSRESAEKVLELAIRNAKQFDELGKLISEINKSSEEQARGIKQINAAVSQIEKSTQNNAAIAEENSAASQELNGEVAVLDRAIEEATKLI